MGRIVVYLCDICNTQYKDPNDVFIIDGIIYNGNEEIIFKDNKSQIRCKNCFQNKIYNSSYEINSDFKDDEEEKEIKPKVKLQKISDEESELDFINYIGYVTKDSFNKIYNKSLIGCYFPTEEIIEEDLAGYIKEEKNIIYKVLAGIPQIKKLNCYIKKNFAFIESDLILNE